MKKLFCLLLAFCALHAVIAQGWVQETMKDRWGDDSGIGYYQGQLGNDSKNKYACAFGFEVMDDVLYFAFVSKIAGDFAIHPGYDIFGGKKVTIQFRKDGAIQTFSGKTTVYDGSNASCTAFVGEAAASIAKLLKGNGTWDVLVECSNWYVRTKVTGNLPLSLDEKDVLILSADGKTVTGVKSWCRNLLENVVIPNGVTSIDMGAFTNCKNLKTVTLPDSVTEIGGSAFWDCSALREVSLPNRLTKIGFQAFSGCIALQTIKIPDSVTEIGEAAFGGCRALKNLQSSVCSIQNGFVIYKNIINSVLDKSLKTYTFPAKISVTKIGDWAFYNCSALQTIKIPNSVTEIGELAFGGCYALREVSLPAKIEAIDCENVFMDCDNLKSITVPKTVKLTNVPRTVQVIRN